MSHPFQEGVGGRDESPKEVWKDRDGSPFPKRGGGTVMSHPKGGTKEEGAPPITAKRRGWGHILLMWPFKTQYLLRRF